MAQIGIVLEVEGDRARVSASRTGACGACSERSSCGVGLGPGGRSDDNSLFDVANALGARPGDAVEIDLPEGTARKVSMLLWVLPLVGLLAGAVLGVKLHGRLGLGEDLAALLGAVAGLAAVFALLVRLDRRARGDVRLEPLLVRIVQRADGAGAVDPADRAAVACLLLPENDQRHV